ncbi:MAG: cyclophilin-like family protein [Promethearchaeota archaeon]
MDEYKIKIVTAVGTYTGYLYPEKCPQTVNVIKNLLPITGVARRWGLEIYFDLNILPGEEIPEENACEVVEYGDLGYWPTGRAFCIFFGPTPASKGDEIRPASSVNVFGKLEGDLVNLDNIKDGDEVKIIKYV